MHDFVGMKVDIDKCIKIIKHYTLTWV